MKWQPKEGGSWPLLYEVFSPLPHHHQTQNAPMNELKEGLAWDLGFCKLYENWSRRYNTNQRIYLYWHFSFILHPVLGPQSVWTSFSSWWKWFCGKKNWIDPAAVEDAPLTHQFHPPNSSKSVKKAIKISQRTPPSDASMVRPAQETIVNAL